MERDTVYIRRSLSPALTPQTREVWRTRPLLPRPWHAAARTRLTRPRMSASASAPEPSCSSASGPEPSCLRGASAPAPSGPAPGRLRLELTSFGFSHKAPKGVDPDSIFDLRALPNPKSYATEGSNPRLADPLAPRQVCHSRV